MGHPLLPADDLPPMGATSEDRVLLRKLEDSVGKHFYESCDGVTQALLMGCEWAIAITAEALTLIIDCPDQNTNWRVLNNIVPIGEKLGQFSQQAKIRVAPPAEVGAPFEIRVDELSIYRDS